METTETKVSVEKSAIERKKDLPSFVPRPNPRITEDEQLRFEKKIRVYFHNASMKVRGKQWDLAVADVERAMKLATDIDWKEAIACAKLMRDVVAQKRSSSEREANAKVVQARFDKRRSARQQRERTEHTRLEVLQEGNRERLREFVLLVKTAKKIEISSLASALELDEATARTRATAMASQFGFKVNGPVILFEKGDKAGFIKALTP